MNKNRHITFRCTQEEYDLIHEARGNMELSDYIRSCIFSEEEDDYEEYMKLQRRIVETYKDGKDKT